ncbi:MAG: GspE/PulE family protein, partial [Candidatus Omnitrophica bacterium]|nr:GspE/PulE family protein [Candidatus Omnitrophota bacterium]
MVFKKISLSGKIKKILVDKGIVSAKEIDEAIKKHQQGQGHLVDVLVNMGLITKKDFITTICSALGYEVIDLAKIEISTEALSKIPKSIAKQYGVMPVEFKEGKLKVALTDPLNIFLLDDIKTVAKCDIIPCVSSEEDIMNAVAEKYEGISHESIEKMVEGISEEDQIDLLDEKEDEPTSKAELLRLTQDAPVVRLTNMLLAEAIKMRASDVLIEPREGSVRIRYRVDGLLIEGKNPPKRVHNAIVSRLKVMSDLNIAERRLPQDGRFKLKIHNREVDFRISVLPSNIGEKVALRVLDKAQVTLDIDKLGFTGKALEDIKKCSEKPHGMILICGPTGCGKTTTMYSILKSIDDPQKNLITVEDPVEYQMFGINQVSVKPDLGLTFAGSLRSILRQDPDIVMIGEIRDF